MEKKKIISLFFMMPLVSYADYDQELLRNYGIDPSIIALLDEGFVLPGQHTFPVYVNGRNKGLIKLTFIDKNDFYIDESLLLQLGLKNKLKLEERNTLLNNYPKAYVEYKNAEINIFIDNEELYTELKREEQKGFGFFANYLFDYDRAFSIEDQSEQDAYYLNLNMGLNVNGYFYRTGLNYDNFSNKITSNYNYFQKNFLNEDVVVKLGDVNILNPSYPNISILGLQYSSDYRGITTVRSRVSGTAKINSIIEIFTPDNVKIYETKVSTGYYELTDVFTPIYVNKLKIVEKGDDGSYIEREQELERVSFDLNNNREYSLSIGFANRKLATWEAESGLYDSYVLSGYSDLYTTESFKTIGSVFIAEDYYFTAGQLIKINKKGNLIRSFGIETGGSSSTKTKQSGGYVVSNLSSTYNGVNLNAFVRWNDKKFQYLDTEGSDSKLRYSLSLSTRLNYIDSFAIGFAKEYYYSDRQLYSTNVLMQKSFKNKSRLYLEGTYDSENNWNVGLTYSIPLFAKNHNNFDMSYYTNRENETYETSVNGILSDYRYGVRMKKNTAGRNSASFYLDKTYEASHMMTSAYVSDEGLQNINFSAEGGLACSTKHCSYTPNLVSDTFAFVKVDDLDNIELNTPSGVVKTKEGVALIPSLNDSVENEITINTKTLPRDVVIDNGYKKIKPSYGDIEHIEIKTAPFYNQLLQLVDENREPIDQNYIIVDMEDRFITTVGFDGFVFFEKTPKNNIYKAKRDSKECIFDLSKEIKRKDLNVSRFICYFNKK